MAAVAQLVEPRIVIPVVVGSIPIRRPIYLVQQNENSLTTPASGVFVFVPS